MIRNDFDYSLYLVTDRGLSKDRTTLEIVEAAVSGGVTCVQLREKRCSTREFIDQALQIRPFLKSKGIPLIINDRLDIALAVKADGVHLGQSDMPLSMARKIVKKKMIIGISVESIDDAIYAEQGGADYLGVSPIFNTPTKIDTAPPLGLSGIKKIRAYTGIPLVGIGGINETNSSEVINNGAYGIAVVSAIVSAGNPEKAARTLRRIVDKAKNR